jgi:predicted nucleic acid-binding protein
MEAYQYITETAPDLRVSPRRVVMEQFNLDFDDAYQYVAAEQTGAVIVSLDADCDRTNRKCQTPKDILRERDSA